MQRASQKLVMTRGFGRMTSKKQILSTRARAQVTSRSYQANSLSCRRPMAITGQTRQQIRNCSSASAVLAPAQPPDPTDSFLQGNAASYIDEMYIAWKQAPETVHLSWKTYFQNVESGEMPISKAFQPPPGLISQAYEITDASVGFGAGLSSDVTNHLKVQLLVRAYQSRGHHKARVDPLGIRVQGDHLPASRPKELELDNYGFTDSDLDKEFELGPGILPCFATDRNKGMTLRDIIDACEKTYCGSYGVEYLHIPGREKCDWIRSRLERPNPIRYTVDQKRRILDRLIWSTSFEKFLATKFPNEKRFGLEGAESLIPGVKALIDTSVEQHGVEDIVIGMQHRGRLNMLSNVVRKPNESIFNEFSGMKGNEEDAGDVKYHLGMNFNRPTPAGKRVQLSLVANPSHLEAEDPVVAGKTRAIQHYKNDHDRSKVMCLTLHGDAAIAGQGIVYETMGLCNLPAYETGGTVHILVNNQIGFTTDPRFSRSTPYCSDIAKAIDAPVFHVNADDVEAVTYLCQLAADWRAEFHTDCVVDIIGYRKHGHNEIDQPMFTQPTMYNKIAKQTPVLETYIKKLLAEKTFSQQDIEEHQKWVWDMLSKSFDGSKDYQPSGKEWLTEAWNGFKSPTELATEILEQHPTAVQENAIRTVQEKIADTPENFTVHRNLQRILGARKKTLEVGKNVDWSTAEALAIGTLLQEGHHVRLSGQDVERGTFSQRHAVLHDQKTEKTWTPLDNLTEDQARLTISNSPLSEFGVLGFEYGYSLSSPNALVIWEAQFGDFVNNAQCIIDQFIVSGESKWLQRSGLVMSLPHGYDGQGPEHSSGRIERFLQLCSEDPRYYPTPERLERLHQDCNIQIVQMTTPANLFHVLRRQIHRQFRKPLIIFFSKSLLRHPLARSTIEDFTGDSQFEYIIPDPAHNEGTIAPPEEIERVIFCTGQIYAALAQHREANGIRNTAITRLEQLNPFPWSQVKDNLNSYPNAKSVVLCQEEALNGGAWHHCQPRIETVLKETDTHKDKRVTYVGRAPSASVAAGMKSTHDVEQQQLLRQAFDLEYS